MGILYEKKEIVLHYREDKPTVYRIAPVKQQQVSFDNLLDEVSSSCGIGRAPVKASVEALLDRMTLFMKYGMTVKLGDFGTFKPTIQVSSQASEEDLGADNVKRKKILFRPGKRFKNMLDDMSVRSFDGQASAEKSQEENPGGGNGGSGDPNA